MRVGVPRERQDQEYRVDLVIVTATGIDNLLAMA
jgi:alanine dehydrogenase